MRQVSTYMGGSAGQHVESNEQRGNVDIAFLEFRGLSTRPKMRVRSVTAQGMLPDKSWGLRPFKDARGQPSFHSNSEALRTKLYTTNASFERAYSPGADRCSDQLALRQKASSGTAVKSDFPPTEGGKGQWINADNATEQETDESNRVPSPVPAGWKFPSVFATQLMFSEWTPAGLSRTPQHHSPQINMPSNKKEEDKAAHQVHASTHPRIHLRVSGFSADGVGALELVAVKRLNAGIRDEASRGKRGLPSKRWLSSSTSEGSCRQFTGQPLEKGTESEESSQPYT
ncbi:hypothetical protein DFH06DRAFT_1147096 [Mycena polygramma]|nr:hypothetical protein DFH06DRAFT_1147096 [Mycena polygramma]